MSRAIDWSLYLVTDRDLADGRSLVELVMQAVRGGVTAVQLREKRCSTREFVELARQLMPVLDGRGVPLIINDRVDVALVVGARGVHIGQDDMPYEDARRMLGPKAVIGLSVETPEQAEEAERLDVDYLGVSPIFSTPTKTDTKGEWGLDGLRRLRGRSRHTLVAIGGLNAANAAQAIRAGADGIAVVSAICAAADPCAAADELRQVVSSVRRED